MLVFVLCRLHYIALHGGCVVLCCVVSVVLCCIGCVVLWSCHVVSCYVVPCPAMLCCIIYANSPGLPASVLDKEWISRSPVRVDHHISWIGKKMLKIWVFMLILGENSEITLFWNTFSSVWYLLNQNKSYGEKGEIKSQISMPIKIKFPNYWHTSDFLCNLMNY